MGAEQKQADKNERMIEVKVRFWTNNIARPKRKGIIFPKQAWDSGVVRIDRNDSHGIKPGRLVHFHSFAGIPHAIEKVLIAHEITLHIGRNGSRYLAGRGGIKP